MARGDQLGRQWTIIQHLLSSRRGKTAAEIAADLNCHLRTVYRDLEALQTGGFPIYNEKIDGKSVWSLLETAKHNIPIPFTLTELMALYFSRDMLKIFKHTMFYDSLESFFQKLKSTLPPEYINYLNQIQKTLHVELKPYRNYEQFKEIIELVNQSAVNKTYIDMTYFGQGRKEETRREVAPYKIWFFDGTFYMIGYCMLRKEIRIFVVDRIREITVTNRSFEIPDDFDFDRYMKSSFGVFTGDPRRVKIRFSEDIAGHIKGKIWHETQRLEDLEGGGVLFEADVAVTEEIKAWIMKWGARAEVLEPASLRNLILQETGDMMKLYEQQTAGPYIKDDKKNKG